MAAKKGPPSGFPLQPDITMKRKISELEYKMRKPTDYELYTAAALFSL